MKIKWPLRSIDGELYKKPKFQWKAIPISFIHSIANRLYLAGHFSSEKAVHIHNGYGHPHATEADKKLSAHF